MEKGLDKKEGILNSSCSLAGTTIQYIFDTGLGKIISASVESTEGFGISSLKFDNFKEENGAVYPGNIVLSNERRRITVGCKIKKIVYPWNEKIVFNFGNRYEILKLL
jgi:hypothetical protein